MKVMLASLILRAIVIAALSGVLLAALGPFGTYHASLPARLGYWVAAMLVGLGLYGGALLAALRLAPVGSRARWPVLVVATLIASAPQAYIVRVCAFWLWPDVGAAAPSWLLWYAQVATIGLVAMLLSAILLGRTPPLPPAASAPSVEPLSGEILALQMEDHYVRVHRREGSELILMPLGRAIEAVGGEGLQTHRSWWVARHAVTGVEGTPRAMRIQLVNGIVAPVARSAVVRLKAAGWIAP